MTERTYKLLLLLDSDRRRVDPNRHIRQKSSPAGDLWECSECAALIIDRDTHDRWHALLAEAVDGPSCRECGCTDDNACLGGCWWAEPDLCSSCADAILAAAQIIEMELGIPADDQEPR